MKRRSALGLLLSAPFGLRAGATFEDPDYAEACRLPDGVSVKRIAAPFPPGRPEFIRGRSSVKNATAAPDALIILQKPDGSFNIKLSHSGGPIWLQFLLQFGLELTSYEYMTTQRLKQVGLPGDWVFRVDATLERKVEDFEHALREKLMPEVSLRFKEVERKAIVARGVWKFAPIAKDGDCVEIFGDYIEEGSKRKPREGSFGDLLRAAAARIGVPIVSEAEGTPKEKTRWRSHVDPRPPRGAKKAEPDAALVLANLAKQTGLEFKEENRKLKTLVIEETPTM
ncbi:MAG TPA: hypothetical protein VNC50_13880 [Planctomycetia bacterium]|nr:hypothetical protein [Planctomycetia bacterium]